MWLLSRWQREMVLIDLNFNVISIKTLSILIGEVMDVRDIKYQSNFFDLIIDKSTIDALLCGDSAFHNTALMMKVLRKYL